MLISNLYRQWRDRVQGPREAMLAEPPVPYAHLPITERLVQAIWYDQRVRTDALRTADGRAVKVLSAGFWNLEAGPDFRRALIQFENEKSFLTDIEIHLHAADWQRHGHSRDPLYKDVGLHVVLWEGEAKPTAIPLLVLQNCLAAPLEELCDTIDPEAYPYSDALHTGRCAQTLLRLSVQERESLLDAAGEERLQQKAQKFARWAEATDFEQALYEGVMEALGYKANKLPFRLIAQRAPHNALPRDPLTLEATLLGLAGFLPKTSNRDWDAASRKRGKLLWDRWWKMQNDFEELALAASAWRFAGLRPQNFPQRRLAAMSLLLTNHPKLLEDLLAIIQCADEPKKTIAALENFFCDPDDPFWSRHYNFGSVAKEPVALIGRARARDILVNVVLPIAVVAGNKDRALALYTAFPHLASNSIEQFAAYRFFGPDANILKILITARRQQGLLQIFRDFCLNDSSACARCRFPDLAAHLGK